MAAATKRRRRRRRREALVYAHLERASRNLFEKYPDIVRRFIGRNAGVYALYRKDRLYYVGLATKLSARLKHHVRGRHGRSWDRFSIYLTIKDEHLKEIETLLLKIARPSGNLVGGKPAGSKDMRRWIAAAIREKQSKEVSALFDRGRRPRKDAGKGEPANGGELLRLLPGGARLKATNKGKSFKARVLQDGRVRFEGADYASLSAAASVALGRRCNGWRFWRVERAKGHWVRLGEIRKAGTPLYRK